MRRPTLGAWLRPLFLGTFGGGLAFAATSASFHRIPQWLAWMPYVTAAKWILWFLAVGGLASLQLVVFAAIDVLLLKTKLRTLPTGWRAFGAAFVATPMVGVALRFWPALGWNVGAWFLTALGMLAAVAVALRVGLGRRIED